MHNIYFLLVYYIPKSIYPIQNIYRRVPRPIAYIIIQTRLPPKYDVIAAAGHVIVQDPATHLFSTAPGRLVIA